MTDLPTGTELRRARSGEAAALTDLALRSKQSNGYDDAFMAACRDELTISEEWLKASPFWVAVQSGRIVGMVGLDVDADKESGEISNFFVDPDCKHRGLGKALWEVLRSNAVERGLTHLHLDADPAAARFYTSIGFTQTDEAPSGSIAGRTLPFMEMTL